MTFLFGKGRTCVTEDKSPIRSVWYDLSEEHGNMLCCCALWLPQDTIGVMETCLSGRKGHPAKVLIAQAIQEFESLRLREQGFWAFVQSPFSIPAH